MGADIYVHIVKYNYNTDKYEEIKLFHKNEKNEIEPVDPYGYRNSDLFDILDGGEYFPNKGIHSSNLPEDLQKEIKKDEEDLYYGFYEVNLADAKLYLKNHPKVRDYDWEDEDTFQEQGWKDNPIKDFIERIDWILEFADPYWMGGLNSPSDVRILYWFG